jgi:hypothetical protein
MLKKMNLVNLIVFVLSSFVSGVCSAASVSYEFTGTINRIDSEIASALSFTVGTPFTGHFTYDSEVTSDSAFYHMDIAHAQKFVWQIGDTTFGHSGEGMTLWIYDNPSYDKFMLFPNLGLPEQWTLETPPAEGGGTWYGSTAYRMDWKDSTGEVFTGNTLPLTLDIADFDELLISFVLFDGILSTPQGTVSNGDWDASTSEAGQGLFLQGQIQTLTVVPEPATIVLFCLGGLAIKRKTRN